MLGFKRGAGFDLVGMNFRPSELDHVHFQAGRGCQKKPLGRELGGKTLFHEIAYDHRFKKSSPQRMRLPLPLFRDPGKVPGEPDIVKIEFRAFHEAFLIILMPWWR